MTNYKVPRPKEKEKKFEWKVDKYKVYSFKNLPEDSKEKALEKYYAINVEDGDWYEDDFLVDMGVPKKIQDKSFKIKQGGTIFKWDKIYFDIDRGDYIQFKNLRVEDEDSFRQTLGVSKKTWDKTDYYFKDNGREGDTYVEFEEKEGKEFTESEKVELEKAQENFSELMHQSKKGLRANYEYLTSRESIEETFEANDYRFTEKGEIA